MEQVLFQVREVVVALNKEVNEKMAERVLKPNSPRWLDCDLNCTACEYASDCIFKQRHDEALCRGDTFLPRVKSCKCPRPFLQIE